MVKWLKKFWANLFVRCPKTNKILGVNFKQASRLFFPFLGLASLVWFLVRVIPKPSRAGYPCMRIAAPVASGFILYLGGLAMSVVAFKKARDRWRRHKYVYMSLFILSGIFVSFLFVGSQSTDAMAKYYHEDLTPNDPIGEAHGIFPGRVVWDWNPDATNEKCSNSAGKDDGWFMPQNNDIDVVAGMLSNVLQSLTGTDDDKAAWDAVFHYNNNNRGKGDVGYAEGEVVYIKINATSSWGGNWNKKDISIKKNSNYGIAETNPYLVLAVLRQLVNVAGVDQLDIYVGDPLKHVYKHAYDLWTAEFPDINVLDVSENRLGRQKIVPTKEPVMMYSDRGKVMHTGSWSNPNEGEPTVSDKYCQTAVNADYLINIPTMKGHARAGVTMFAKNHFGSHTRGNAVHLHGGLVDPTQDGKYTRFDRNIYRVQVDLMGHEMHYKKGLFYLMDALYAGSEATDPPRKFQMAPFNNDWCSSLFISLDPVAIESVGFDFLRTEYNKDSTYPYPTMPAVDDYLHQAADSSEWPEGIVYDPEEDGTPIPSLGAHEHWNNSVDMQYTRNLETGDGIELVKIMPSTGVAVQDAPIKTFELYQNYPNPFNPSTTIRFDLDKPSKVRMDVYNMNGRLVKSYSEQFMDRGAQHLVWNGAFADGSPAPSGVYIYRLTAYDGIATQSTAKQMVMLK